MHPGLSNKMDQMRISHSLSGAGIGWGAAGGATGAEAVGTSIPGPAESAIALAVGLAAGGPRMAY